MPNPNSPSLTTLIQYALFAIVAYILAGAPTIPIPSSLSSLSLSPSSPSTSISTQHHHDDDENRSSNQHHQHQQEQQGQQHYSNEKIESLIVPDPNLVCEDHGYRVRVLRREPLVVYVEGFLSEGEARRVVELSTPNWEPSTIWTGGTQHYDPSIRKSDKAALDPSDHTISCISERARAFQGWRPFVFIERLWAQRYEKSGHYMYHFDFGRPGRGAGKGKGMGNGRVSSFMVYLEANCTGGGTNFPRLERPVGREWCEFIECGEGKGEGEGEGGGEGDVLLDGSGGKVEGVTFKPIAGNAVFWENLREDGSAYPETWHAGLPVKSGVKIGLNIWSWLQEGYVPPPA